MAWSNRLCLIDMSSPSIKKNFIYKSILTLSTYLINLMIFPYVSRVLGVEYIGLVNFVDNTVNYFLLFATMGMSILGIREIAAVKNDFQKKSQAFSNLMGMNIVFTLFTLVVYLTCIAVVPKFNQYEELFYIGAGKILFTAFLVEWFFTGVENFRYITLRSLFIKCIYVIAILLFIQSPADYRLYFILTVGVVVINALINTVYVYRFIDFRFKDLFFTRFYKQNCILGLYAIMTSMYLTFNVMYLGLVSDNVEVGYYTTAFKLYYVILGLFSAFTSVMLPRMSTLISEGEGQRFHELIGRSFMVITMFSVPLIVCTIALAPQMIFILAGGGYEGAILPMRIIMPAVLFVGIAQVLAIQVLIPMKKDKILLKASVVGASIAFLINLIAVHRLKSIGSALVLVVSETVVTLFYILYIHHQKLIQLPLRYLGRSVVSAMPAFLVCLFCSRMIDSPYLSFAVAFISGGIAWLVAFYLMKRGNAFKI